MTPAPPSPTTTGPRLDPAALESLTTIKALVVRMPWADQIARGAKRIEYRSRRTHHRGPLLICVAKAGGGEYAGKAICIVNLADCQRKSGGMWAWVLSDVLPIEPFLVKGRLGLFTVDVSAAQI